MADLVRARKKGAALQAELEHPTFSRLYGTQMMLLEAVKSAGDECHSLLIAMRANRKARNEANLPAIALRFRGAGQ